MNKSCAKCRLAVKINSFVLCLRSRHCRLGRMILACEEGPVTDEDIAAAQREECDKGRSGMSLCGIDDCRKCPKSSIFDSDKYGTIAFDAAVSKPKKSESKFCGSCEHAHVDCFPHILYGRKRDGFKFCRVKNRPTCSSDDACGEYSPNGKSFPKEESTAGISEAVKDMMMLYSAASARSVLRIINKDLHKDGRTRYSLSQKQALDKLRKKNQDRFAQETLRGSEVYQNATPEEKAGMNKLAEYLVAKEDEGGKKQSCSAAQLKDSSTYKCALPEERESMLIRHYELEIAKTKHLLNEATDKATCAVSCDFDHMIALSGVIDRKEREISKLKEANAGLTLEAKRLKTCLRVRKKIAAGYKIKVDKKLKRANAEITALNGCNRKLEEEVEELRERLYSRKKALNADLVAANESLAKENARFIKERNGMLDIEVLNEKLKKEVVSSNATIRKLIERLAGVEKLEGKWRLLEEGEPYMRGDMHQIVEQQGYVVKLKWMCLEGLAGDKHDGQDIVIRKITFE